MIGETDHSTYKPALTYHPLANLFPMIEGPERVAFRQSIRDKGLRVRIVMHEGMILDGRNRYRELLGLQLIDHATDWSTSPYFRAFGSEETDGNSPLDFVMDLNLDRRHLNESQRASVAARMATMNRGERTDLKDGSSLGEAVESISRAEAAERLNVSERSVNSAKKVQDQGAPELVDAVDQGVLPVSVAEKLLTLPVEEQTRLVKEESPAVIKNAAKKAQRSEKEVKLAAKQKALPNKLYGVIYEDPAWRFEPRSRETGLDRAADNHYPTMTIEELRKLPVGDIAATDCVLFMWVTVPFMAEALDLIERRGFTYKSEYIWDKTPWDGDGADAVIKGAQGTGFWSRVNHEVLIVATRGAPPAPAPGENFPSVYREVAGAHSAKPEHYSRMIERYYPNMPKIELNARAPRDGWDVWGNESEGNEPKTEKPNKAKKDTRSKYVMELEAYEGLVAARIASLPTDYQGLVKAYAAGIHAYNGAFLASDADAVKAARVTMDAVLKKVRSEEVDSDLPTCQRGDAIRHACAAPSGEEPIWGQDGHFIAEADGVRAIVSVGHSGGIHAVDLDRPFPSCTGYVSVTAQPQLGQTVEAYGQACIRAGIAYSNSKDKAQRAAHRGLMMPERAYRLDAAEQRGIVSIERGIALPDNWAIGEVSSSQLISEHDAWLAELHDFGIKKRKWPESRHHFTPIFAFRYRDGVPVAVEPVADFPVEGGYVFRCQNGGSGGWKYVAGGEAERRITPLDLDVQPDPRPDFLASTCCDPAKAFVTPAELLEYKVITAIALGLAGVVEGPVIAQLLKDGDVYRDNGRIDLTQRGWATAELLKQAIDRAMVGEAINVCDPLAKSDVDSVNTDEKSVNADYIAELAKVADRKGNLHQSTAEPVMRAAYAAEPPIPLAQLAADLGHPPGTIKTWANRLKLTSRERMLAAQAPAFTAEDGFDQLSAEVPDVNGDAVRAGLKVALTEDIEPVPYEVRRVYKNGNISISNASGHQQVIKVGDFVLFYEAELAE